MGYIVIFNHTAGIRMSLYLCRRWYIAWITIKLNRKTLSLILLQLKYLSKLKSRIFTSKIFSYSSRMFSRVKVLSIMCSINELSYKLEKVLKQWVTKNSKEYDQAAYFSMHNFIINSLAATHCSDLSHWTGRTPLNYA